MVRAAKGQQWSTGRALMGKPAESRRDPDLGQGAN